MDNLLLTQKLNNLVDKLQTFIDGNEDEVVSTTNGALPTIRGVIEEIKRTRPVQFISEFTNIQGAVLDSAVTIGDVVRIKNVGYFQKNNLGGFDKVGYSDLYDLRDVKENPFNNDYERYTIEQPVVKCEFNVSSLEIAYVSFKIKLIATSKDVTTHAAVKEYNVLITSKTSGQIQATLLLTSLVETWSRNDLTIFPSIVVGQISSTLNKNSIELLLQTAKVGVSEQLYNYDVMFENIDTKNVKVIRRLYLQL